MVKRPIINTRDEPHADREKYRRLHVIVGDANLSEYTIYLRNGATAIVLAMIEDGAITKNLSLRDPVRAIKEISHDATCKHEFPLDDGKRRNAVEIQADYLEMALAYTAEAVARLRSRRTCSRSGSTRSTPCGATRWSSPRRSTG